MAEELTIPVRQLIALHRGLNSLDAVKEGRDELIGFEFDRKVRWNLTKLTVAVERAMEAYNKEDRARAKKHGVYEGMPANEKSAQAIAAYTDDMEVAKDDTVTLSGVLFLKLDDLLNRPPGDSRKVNPIPQSVLKNLAPIINDP